MPRGFSQQLVSRTHKNRQRRAAIALGSHEQAKESESVCVCYEIIDSLVRQCSPVEFWMQVLHPCELLGGIANSRSAVGTLSIASPLCSDATGWCWTRRPTGLPMKREQIKIYANSARIEIQLGLLCECDPAGQNDANPRGLSARVTPNADSLRCLYYATEQFECLFSSSGSILIQFPMLRHTMRSCCKIFI